MAYCCTRSISTPRSEISIIPEEDNSGIIFLIFPLNMLWIHIRSALGDTSNEYPQHMFFMEDWR